MPVNMTVQEPRSWIVGGEAERDIVVTTPYAHNIPTDGVLKVVFITARNAYDVEIVSVKMERMLEAKQESKLPRKGDSRRQGTQGKTQERRTLRSCYFRGEGLQNLSGGAFSDRSFQREPGAKPER